MCEICNSESPIQEVYKRKKVKNHLKQAKLDRVFINIAKELAKLSHCVSRQVGVVVVKKGRIIATGINGSTAGDVNCDEVFEQLNFDRAEHRKWSDINEIHGEMNAINWSATHGLKLKGATLYTSLQPCMECSKNIPAAGIKRIVFDDFYDRVDNFEEQRMYLERKGVIIEKLPNEAESRARFNEVIKSLKPKKNKKNHGKSAH